MIEQKNLGPDAARSQLRATMLHLEHEIAELPAPAATNQHDALRASFDALSDLLALGPEPELRECTHCGHFGMRTATRCGHCWSALAPFVAA